MDLDNSTVKYVKHNAIPAMGVPELTSINVTEGDQTWSVPMADDNSNYQKILAWVAEGNTIEPADE
jgi:hypothetical protein